MKLEKFNNKLKLCQDKISKELDKLESYVDELDDREAADIMYDLIENANLALVTADEDDEYDPKRLSDYLDYVEEAKDRDDEYSKDLE